MERLKPGGRLAYGAGSHEPEENTEVVRAFLVKNCERQVPCEHALTRRADGVDSAFVARFVRLSEPAGGPRHLTRGSLQFQRHLKDAVVKLREHLAGLLCGHFVAKLDGPRRRHLMQRGAVFAVDHDAQQFAGLGEHQVAA